MDRIAKKSNEWFSGFEIFNQLVDQLPIVNIGSGKIEQPKMVFPLQIINQRMRGFVASWRSFEAIAVQLKC